MVFVSDDLQMKSRIARRRRKLWEEDPHCRKCGRLTILSHDPPKKSEGNMATIQHIHSRLDEKRGKVDGETTTLFCWRCNNDDNRDSQANLPIEILRRRAKLGHSTENNSVKS